MRECPCCVGHGTMPLDEGEEIVEDCFVCSGTGYDPMSCEQCDEDGVGFNEDGDFLCEDCLFESMIEDAD